MQPRDGQPWIWTTWITPVLAGEAQCQYAPYVKAHFRYTKRPDDRGFNLAKWNADHTMLLEQRCRELSSEGWTIALENENSFRLKGKTAVLAGKPDIIAHRADEWRVIDAKTGAAKNRDFWQVLLYLAAVPRAFGIPPDRLTGEVCYPTHRINVTRVDLTTAKEARIWSVIRSIASEPAPIATPSAAECAFCDIAECQYRITSSVTEVLVSEF
jgi:CRISPR/Cas system-associated exonuclease Cas4 (RecB family)